ncbi:hypothetical protein H6768_05080 [Candidatus Peribacteria bacterium]|nr:hypothetical protein [Candidatus Peribacteria bacterium]
MTRPISVNYFPNRNATRAEVFEFARNIFEKKEAEIPEVTSFNKDVVETINKVSEGFDIVLIDKYDAHFGDNDVEPLVIKVRFNY